MYKNTVEPERPQMTTWPMCILCWMPKNMYFLLSPLQQWLHERASLLHLNICTCPDLFSTPLKITQCNGDGEYLLLGTN